MSDLVVEIDSCQSGAATSPATVHDDLRTRSDWNGGHRSVFFESIFLLFWNYLSIGNYPS